MTREDMDLQPDSPWECIDPDTGACLWELDLAETSAERISLLNAHLELCDACRLDEALSQRLEEGLATGELALPTASDPVIRPAAWWRHPAALASAGTALIAACLTLMMILPPPSVTDPVHLRSDTARVEFLRPLEGEVVPAGSAVLTWTPVAGATRYRISVSGVDVDFTWEETTEVTELKLPVLDPPRQHLRAVLTTVPSDLVPAGQISVSFHSGSRLDVARDRWTRRPLWLDLLLNAGVVLLVLGLLSLGRRTRFFARD